MQGFEVSNLVALLRLTDSWKKERPEAKADLSTAVLLAMIIIAMAFAQIYLIRKIRRLDLATFSSQMEKRRISGFKSPRYRCPGSASLDYKAHSGSERS